MPRTSLVVGSLVGLSLLASCKGCGCGKKDEDPIVAPVPAVGAASPLELTTGLGPARALEEGLAPSTTKWKRVFALDDKRVILTGDATTESIALVTEDAGRTWRALRTEKEQWSNWNASPTGQLLFATGARGGGKTNAEGMAEKVKLAFAASDAPTLGPPTPLFPPEKGPFKGTVLVETAIPAILPENYAGLVGEEAPRRQAVFFGGKPGATATPPVKLPPGEKGVLVPFGRPPMLLSVRGRDLLARPFPEPGKPLEKPEKIKGVVAGPTTHTELSTVPACDFGEWSFQKVKQDKGKLALVAVGGGKASAFALPEETVAATRIGCNGARVIVETLEEGQVRLQSCTTEGACEKAKNAPFRVWPEQHERDIVSAPTDKGILAALLEKTGQRWGFYMAQSIDSAAYEQPRVVAEGKGDRGRLELGALVPMGARVMLIVSSEITGTSRRGWFVSVTDDGGVTWNSP